MTTRAFYGLGALALAVGLMMQGPAQAQEAEAAAPGTVYVRETSGDWEVRCIRTQLDHDPCTLFQLLRDDNGNDVAQYEIVTLPPGQRFAAGVTIVTPLETLLTQQVQVTVDKGLGKRYPFNYCNNVGCFARFGATDADLRALREGTMAEMVIYAAAAPQQEVALKISLMGVSAGLDKIAEYNAAAAADAAAARAAAQAQGTTEQGTTDNQ